MATHFSILFWRIPWTEEPGGLRSMGSQRVGHDRAHTNITALLTEDACDPGSLPALLSQGREDKAQGKSYT